MKYFYLLQEIIMIYFNVLMLFKNNKINITVDDSFNISLLRFIHLIFNIHLIIHIITIII